MPEATKRRTSCEGTFLTCHRSVVEFDRNLLIHVNMPLPLSKRIKARPVDEDDVYDEDLSDDSSPSVIETGAADEGRILSSGDEDEDGAESDDGHGDDAVQGRLSNISFGTLRKAQDSLSRKRKRDPHDAPHNDDKLDALRARLRELREQKGIGEANTGSKKVSAQQKSGKKHHGSDSDDKDDDTESGDDRGPPKSRSSKHAPASMPSNRQVTRKRNVVDVPKRHVRDPRFGPLSGVADETALQKNYSFLNDYQETEMTELKAAIKKSKNEDEKEILKRKLLSMESKKKSRESKDRQQAILREHRKKEKEAIEQGKKPFYLKASEQKKLALVDKYNSMKGKDREKLMERRRKKVAGREKKNMPQARRMVE